MRIVLVAFIIGLGIGGYWLYTPTQIRPVIYSVSSINYDSWIKHIDRVESLAITASDPLLQMELVSMGETLQASLNNSMVQSLPGKLVTAINPCGDNIGYDVFFFRMSSGALVYYDKEEKAFMSAVPGEYLTRDQNACHVVITNQMQVCSGVVCD